MEVRIERIEDINAIFQVNVAAFGRKEEAILVDRLRDIESTFSFVAVEAKKVVGHIFYSPVEIEGQCSDNLFILGLAPMAVLPEHQRQGIGSLLIRYSLEECTGLGYKAVVVLGHPEFYSRFGFVPAKEKGLRCEYKVPDDVFMVLELENGTLENCIGTVKYRSEFREVE
ncbi:MAG: GNAT family N-acetyltransferase [Pseudanabaena frigida]|uniref:GNAT family N-acetyltransferase n=1 Tax=Pseudanabaena frigida TaxID=945775 RepID=A0A2W4VZ81_9CYAN|nr:MAG: GNAT family N-acetyltransferase [Pseudanabaena frigida]